MLLRCFTQERYTLSARELVEFSGLPKSTTHRLIGHLVSLGLLNRTRSGRYSVGSLVWELGQYSELQTKLRSAAQVHLTRVYDESGENAFLGVLTTRSPDTAEVMYIGQVRGARSAPTRAREGNVFPVLDTAMGAALAAAQTPEWCDRVLRRMGPQERSALAGGVEHLRGSLSAGRRSGYLVQFGEGSVAIAAAIPAGQAYPPCGVEVVLAQERWDEPRFAYLVRDAAQNIATELRLGA